LEFDLNYLGKSGGERVTKSSEGGVNTNTPVHFGGGTAHAREKSSSWEAKLLVELFQSFLRSQISMESKTRIKRRPGITPSRKTYKNSPQGRVASDPRGSFFQSLALGRDFTGEGKREGPATSGAIVPCKKEGKIQGREVQARPKNVGEGGKKNSKCSESEADSRGKEKGVKGGKED